MTNPYIQQHQPDSRYLLNAAASCNYCRQIPEINLRAFADSQSAGTAVLDEAGDIVYVNRAWHEVMALRGFVTERGGPFRQRPGLYEHRAAEIESRD